MEMGINYIEVSGNNAADKAVAVAALIIFNMNDFSFKAVRVVMGLGFIFNKDGQVVGGDCLKHTCAPIPLILDQSLKYPTLV